MRPLADVLTDERRLSRGLQRLPATGQSGLERYDHVEVAFMARLLTLCALPRRNRGDERQYNTEERAVHDDRDGNRPARPTVRNAPAPTTGVDLHRSRKDRSARLRLGATLAEFMRELGITSRSGGVRGDRTRLRDQIERLFNASIRLSYEGEGVTRSVASMIADRSELWWEVDSPETPSMWRSTVRLGSDFFTEILRRPVPVDMATLRTLRPCALGVDLYLWLTYATFRLDRPRRITWPVLYRQFADQPREQYDKNEVADVSSANFAGATQDQSGLANAELPRGSWPTRTQEPGRSVGDRTDYAEDSGPTEAHGAVSPGSLSFLCGSPAYPVVWSVFRRFHRATTCC